MSSPANILGSITKSGQPATNDAPYGLNPSERVASSPSRFRDIATAVQRGLNVALPAIVQSFNSATQTVVVQLAITDEARVAGVPQIIQPAFLSDIPVVLPRAGGYTLTLPITAGDECLVVFGDRCIDAWFQSGGQQNQIYRRRHDLSDGFAILGCWSQPRVLQNYSTASSQLRNDAGTVTIDVAASQVTVTAPTVQVSASQTAAVSAATVNVTGTSQVNISGNQNTMIEGRNFLHHTHSGVQGGSSVSGPVV